MASRFLNAAKACVNKPGNEFFLVIILVPLPMIFFAEPSKWIALATLAYTALIARLYGGSRWLDGYVAGDEAIQHARALALKYKLRYEPFESRYDSQLNEPYNLTLD